MASDSISLSDNNKKSKVKIFGIKEYWYLKGQFLEMVCDPLFQLDVDFIIDYITQGTKFGKTMLWEELSYEQKVVLCKRLTLREYSPESNNENKDNKDSKDDENKNYNKKNKRLLFSDSDSSFKMQFTSSPKSGEIFLVLQGNASVEVRHRGHSDGKDNFEKIGDSFGSWDDFQWSLHRMVEKRDGHCSNSDCICQNKEGKHDPSDPEYADEFDERDNLKYIITGKRISVLRLTINDYNIALQVGLPPNAQELLLLQMSEAERQIYEITRRFRECNTGVELSQFLESHGLIGRVIKANAHTSPNKNKNNSNNNYNSNSYFSDTDSMSISMSVTTEDEKEREVIREEDVCDLKYYKIGQRGHKISLDWDDADMIYLVLSGCIRVNIKVPSQEGKMPIKPTLNYVDREMDYPEGADAPVTIAFGVPSLPLLQMVPGSVVAIDEMLFDLVPHNGHPGIFGELLKSGNGSGIKTDDIDIRQLQSLSVNSSLSLSSSTSNSNNNHKTNKNDSTAVRSSRKQREMDRKREAERLMKMRNSTAEKPNAIVNLKKKVKEEIRDPGPFLLELEFDKYTEYFAIPVTAIKKELKTESYSTSKLIHEQLFQASTLCRERLIRVIPWLQQSMKLPLESAIAPPKNESKSDYNDKNAESDSQKDVDMKYNENDSRSTNNISNNRKSPSKVKTKLMNATVLPSEVDRYFKNRVDPKISLVEPELLGTYTRYRKQLLPLSKHYHNNMIGVSSNDDSSIKSDADSSVYAASFASISDHPMNSKNAKLVSQSLGPGVFVTAKDMKDPIEM